MTEKVLTDGPPGKQKANRGLLIANIIMWGREERVLRTCVMKEREGLCIPECTSRKQQGPRVK